MSCFTYVCPCEPVIYDVGEELEMGDIPEIKTRGRGIKLLGYQPAKSVATDLATIPEDAELELDAELSVRPQICLNKWTDLLKCKNPRDSLDIYMCAHSANGRPRDIAPLYDGVLTSKPDIDRYTARCDERQRDDILAFRHITRKLWKYLGGASKKDACLAYLRLAAAMALMGANMDWTLEKSARERRAVLARMTRLGKHLKKVYILG